MTHLLALIGFTLLCAVWIVFQLWLKRADPERGDFHPGCGACQGGGCGNSPQGSARNTSCATTRSRAPLPPRETGERLPGENK
jgi:hypothetical protein